MRLGRLGDNHGREGWVNVGCRASTLSIARSLTHLVQRGAGQDQIDDARGSAQGDAQPDG